jgi:hypothetical protein
MSYRDEHDDDYRGERPLEDREYPEPDDEDDELVERKCPHCGEWIDAEYERCPECGQWITAETSPLGSRPWWWLVLGAAGIAALIWALARV